jgi:hypothetical protein
MLFMEFCFRIVLDGIVYSLFIFSYYIFVPIAFLSNTNVLTGIYEILTVSLPNVVSTKIFLTVWPPFLNFGNTTLNLALPSHVVA